VGRRALGLGPTGALLAVAAVLLLLGPSAPPLVAHPTGALPAPHGTPSAALTPSSVAPPAVAPAVTALYDWDPQPLILPPSFPAAEVAGEGAVMATSDPFGTVVLFGGEAPSGLSNRTITVNESTGYWNVAPIPGGPSPRANVSIATVDGGRYAVVFGGIVNLTSGSCDNGTWLFDFVNRSWTNHSGSVAPPPRESAAFAADDGAGYAVLEGGWDPSYSLGGAGASVTWNDTWLLNLTTFNWSRSNASYAPRPLFGSSMWAVPATHRFYLFGGCATFCSNALYSLVVGGNWTRVPDQGDIPSPRASASSAWGATWNLAFVSNGFVWGGNDYFPLNDTFAFDPVTLTWDLVVGPDGPSARFGAAASYLNNNHCEGLFLVGGSSALAQPPADGWFLDSNPDLGAGCDIWGGDRVGGSGGGGAGNCSAATQLSVDVVDSSNFQGIGAATVQLIGRCGTVQLATNATGYANFTALPNETVRVLVAASGFHQNQTDVNLSLQGTSVLLVLLDHLPSLHIQTFGVSYERGIEVLENVSVYQYPLNFNFLGATDVHGWLNVTAYAGAQGSTTFLALKPGYSNATATVNIPWTGVVSTVMTLYADGPFAVHVTEYPDGLGISGATGVIRPVGAYSYGGPIPYVTGLNGWFNLSLPQSNYTVSAAAPGFVSNGSAPVAHLWASLTVVPINLTLIRGGNLSVQLLDAVTHRPIAGGDVLVGTALHANTTSDGWAYFPDIRPPGHYGVVGTASGYRSNSTSVELSYLALTRTLVLNLTPITSCPPTCGPATNGTPGTYHLLPTSGAALDLFVLAPILLALAGALYAVYLRRRAGVDG